MDVTDDEIHAILDDARQLGARREERTAQRALAGDPVARAWCANWVAFATAPRREDGES